MKDIDNFIKTTKWLIEDKFKLSDKEIKEVSITFFDKNGLGFLIQKCFKGNIYEAINSVYPNKFKEWEFKSVPKNYWYDINNGINATKWLIEDKLRLSDDELKKQLSIKLFKDNGLDKMLKLVFNNSPYEAINTIYPNKFKPWEFNIVNKDYWINENNRKSVIKWLIEEKLKLSDDELREQLSVKLFKDNGLEYIFKNYFNNNPYEAINTIYPNRFIESDFEKEKKIRTQTNKKGSQIQINKKTFRKQKFNDDNNYIENIKLLIEEKLKLSDDEIKEQLSVKFFKENGLDKTLRNHFNSSPYKAINTVYPNRFKEWEFNYVPRGYWSNIDNGINATKWLVDEKLKLSDDELEELLCIKLFKDNGLRSMLITCFNNNPYEAINTTYPNKFKGLKINQTFKNRNKAIRKVKYVLEKKLKLSDEEIKEKLSVKFLNENGLGGILTEYFNGSPYEVINIIYPNKFKPWELNRVPNGYWEDINNGIKTTKWLIEDKLKLSNDEIKEQLSVNFFRENGLGKMLKYAFNSSPYKAINKTYPNKFKPWEFNYVSKNYWKSEDNRKLAIKWLIEEKLKWSNEEIKEQLSAKSFKEHGLYSLLSAYFHNNPYEAINFVYPNTFDKSYFNNNKHDPELKQIDNEVDKIKWLIEKKLKLSDDEIKEQLSANFFKKHGLSKILIKNFNGSYYNAINSIYPNKFKEWEFKNCHYGFWNDVNNGIKATKWLIGEKLKLSDDEIKKQLSVKIFKEYGLDKMLYKCFNGNTYECINLAYPNKFQPWDFKKVPCGYWNDMNNGIKATKWLIEDKLKLSDKEIKEQLSVKMFKEYGLNGMLKAVFNYSPYDAINTVYPNKFKKSDFKNSHYYKK